MIVQIGNVVHDVKVAAAMSMPRLAFTDNYFCSFGAFAPHGIQITKGTGAFWDQTMSRILTELSSEESGNQFIYTIDYDSVYEPECVTRLMAAMLISGCDALAPLQTKRDDQHLMFTPKGMAGCGKQEVTLPNEWWESPAQPVDTAHFGLTILRASALRRMPKPWFLGVPNDEGDWGENRKDPDIFFWDKWRECGNSLCVCPQVAIGHAELVITWPTQKLKAVHQYPTHFWNSGGKRPPEAWGSEAHAERSAK
jgi:hypothetical protein